MHLPMKHIKKIGTGIFLALFAHAVYFFAPTSVVSVILAIIPAFIFIFEWPTLLNAIAIRYPKLFNPKKGGDWEWLFTLVYLVLPFVLLIFINNAEPRWLLLLFFYTVFMCDIGGYVFGTLFGKHTLSKYSPNKSWEGVLGAIIFSSITAFSILRFHTARVSLVSFFFFITLMAISAVLGDLFESYLKRLANIKDSGSWLPGHGGLLDRFDSCLFSSIVFYLFVYFRIIP